jgi:hypothetical protein
MPGAVATHQRSRDDVMTTNGRVRPAFVKESAPGGLNIPMHPSFSLLINDRGRLHAVIDLESCAVGGGWCFRAQPRGSRRGSANSTRQRGRESLFGRGGHAPAARRVFDRGHAPRGVTEELAVEAAPHF